MAFLRGRDYALPGDVTDLVPDVLRHRLVLSYEALAEGLTSDALIEKLLRRLPAALVRFAALRKKRVTRNDFSLA